MAILRNLSDPRARAAAVRLAVIVIFVVLCGLAVSQVAPEYVIVAALLIVLLLVCFINVEAAIYLLIFSFLLSPEYGEKTTAITAVRTFSIRLDDLLLLVITLSWLIRSALQKELGQFFRTPLTVPIFAYTAICILSSLIGYSWGWVDDPVESTFFVLKYIQYFVLFFVLSTHIQSEAQIRRFLIVLFVTCAVVCVFGILQIPTGQRVSAPFEGQGGEPNTFGGFLVLMFALALGLLLQARLLVERVLWSLMTVLIFVPFLYTLSRASWFAAGFVVLTLLLMSKKRLLIAAVIGLILLTGLLGVWPVPEGVQARLEETLGQTDEPGDTVLGVTLDLSATVRLRSWVKALEAWVEEPVSVAVGRGVRGIGFVDGQYVRVICETGLIGLGFFLWLLGSLYRQGWTTYQSVHRPFHRGVALGYMAGLAGLTAHALFANTFIIIRIMEPFFFLTAILVHMPRLETR